MTDEDRLEALSALSAQLRSIAEKDRLFREATGCIPKDLDRISELLKRSPTGWRQVRSLHAVHVPSLSAAVQLYAEMQPQTGGFAEDRDAILAAFSRAAALFSDARNTLEQDLASRARLEAEALAYRAPVPAAAHTSFLGRARSGITGLGALAANAASNAAGSALTDISTRAFALPKLGGSFGSSLMEIISGNITAPVAIRLSASRKALYESASAGTGLGVVIGILCPPLLPLAASGAVLAAIEAYRSGVDDLSALEAGNREQRLAQLRAARSQALRELAQGSSALQLESEDLSLTIDVETGAADAIVLTGPNSGRSYSSLSETERAEIQNRVRRESDDDGKAWLLLDILGTGLAAATFN